MKRTQSGFTLIEIAIVLVIIGLLLGGVLKGQELINSARVKNLANDFRNVPVFIYGYQDRFHAVPGDQTQPTLDSIFPPANTATACAPTGTASCAPGNGVINGNWNDATAAAESFVFWQHVRLAGLAPGSTVLTDPTYVPQNASGGIIGVQSGTTNTATTPINTNASGTNVAIRGTFVICSAGILGRFVTQLDTQMDDGNTQTGSMMAGVATAPGTPMTAVATTAIDPAASYTVCMGV